MTRLEKLLAQPDMRTLIGKIGHTVLHYTRFPARIPSVPRIAMEAQLLQFLPQLSTGTAIDIGAGEAPYRHLVRCARYLSVELAPVPGADLVSDIHHLALADGGVDAVIATEVLEHCRDPRLAVAEMHRVLKPGGVCVITTRFIQPYHPTPRDYYRFTRDSLADLFAQFSEVMILHHGNTLQSIWTLLSATPLRWISNLLNPLIARVNSRDTVNPCGFLVRATK